MNAPERVLTAIQHEEPDRVPAFESAFTNNTIMEHYGIRARALSSQIPKIPDKMLRKAVANKKIMKLGLKKLYEFNRRAGLDIVPSICSVFPRTVLEKGTFIDEYGRVMKSEIYEKDGTMILGYVEGHFKSFEDYESWEQPDPHWEARVNGFLAGRELQQEKFNNEIFSIPSTGSLMERIRI